MTKIIRVGLIVVAALMLFCACAPSDTTPEAPAEDEATSASAVEGMRNTLLYFETSDGYIVPVMKNILWEEGIAKAALNAMTATEQNEQGLGDSGLRAILPADASFDIDIANGIATVDVGMTGLASSTAMQEENMVTAIVDTLTEFEAIDSVQFMFNGERKDTLKFGYNVSQPIAHLDVNIETMASIGDKAQKAVLYFSDNMLLVPVTRYLKEEANVQSAITEMLTGPKEPSKLKNLFPKNTKLLGVDVVNGVVSVNFSKEFDNIKKDPETEQSLMKALFLTCYQFEGVDEVVIRVEGKDYQFSVEQMMAPVFAINQM